MKAHIAMKSSARLAAVVLVAVVSLALAGCFYMPGVSGSNARAGLVLPRYIAGNTSSIVLIVGGPGMNTIYSSFPAGTTSASVSVPSGASRTFTVLANTPSVTFRGEATVDLAPDETKEITLTPTLFATQIIVPDYSSTQLVQISDMSGTGRTTLPGGYPYDVDFDDQGRIYVANNDGVSDGVTRMDDISGANLTGITGTIRYIRSIAMDRTHGLLYYTDGSSLWKILVTPAVGTELPVDLSSIVANPSIAGIAVDSDGIVYVATTYPTVAILKIDAGKPQLVKSYTGSLQDPWDVLVNGDYVYVSDFGAKQIVRLTKNLDPLDSFPGPATDPFLGPERFVAILNKPITVIDETPYNQGNRLVSFGDMTGAGWTTYEPKVVNVASGQLEDQFVFFYNNLAS